MLKEAIIKLSNKQDLTQDEAHASMSQIMSGEATDAQIAAFLMGLRLKGETVDEIVGCARVMREKSVRITTKREDVIDTCGTGGDTSGTFNISTTAAIVASAGGAAVAKHGNRAVSSKCGSADVLKALGVNIEATPEQSARTLDEVGITFMFAPLMHGAMKHAAPVRKELGVRTIFNILGPLTNPAGAKRQVLGVFNPALTETLANVLNGLGGRHALVVHGEGGVDEFSTTGWSKVSELKDGKVHTYTIDVHELGLRKATAEDLRGGDSERNAVIVREILNGQDGPMREIVLFNSGAALYVAGKANTLDDGIRRAAEVIDSGAAKQKLSDWVEASNS
ncbi:MAG: anthranilate phosphoribosyltransferase [Ignavibacteriae bacterium]|nr:anthranilate phosphoribosyltransferase [Ignavibacteriota bacterium]